MADLWTPQTRSGEFIHDLALDPGLNTVTLRMPIDVEALKGRPPIALRVTLQQSPDGLLWWTLGGFATRDVLASAEFHPKTGQPLGALTASFREQIVRHDIFLDQKYSESWELKNDEDGAWYHQLALESRFRLVFDSYVSDERGEKLDHADLFYGCDFAAVLGAKPAAPIGRRSASLLGTFAAAESGTTSATSGSRTTVAASLVVGQGSTWNSTDTGAVAITDNKSNAFTEHFQETVSAGAGSFGEFALSSNNNGTRGTTHTLTSTSGTNGTTVGGLEFDGVDTAATPNVGTVASGTSTAPSCSVTPDGGASLVVGLMAYDSTGTTFAASDGTLGIEVDENNDRQANGSLYKVAASGATTIAWTIAASRPWVCRAVAWEEIAAAATLPHHALLIGVGL